MTYKNPILALLLLTFTSALFARQQDTDSIAGCMFNAEVSFTGGGATGQWAPYLIGSNSGGRHAMAGTSTVSGLIYKDWDKSKRFSWTAGFEGAAGYHASARYDYYNNGSDEWSVRTWHPSNATVYQLWAGVKYRGVMLWAGMRDHVSPIVDDDLSSGDLTLSNNARAIPQVVAGFIDYQNIPFTKGWVQINGSISYGKFTDNGSIKGRYNYWNDHITLGQLFTYKHVHFRTRTDKPFSITIGVQSAGEFGGTTYWYHRGNMFRVNKQASDLRAFWEMFIPTLRHSDGFVEGNQVGSWDLNARYRLRDGILLEGYFQWFWEDGSSMGRRNRTDGLWGLGITMPGQHPFLKKAIVEYIDMRDQSGPIHWAPSDNPGTTIGTEATGGDNYYNSSSFNAWANYGLGLGSSFPKAPLYNADGFPQFEHNRTHGFQLACTGFITDDIDWKVKLSYAAAWGTGRIPYARTLKNTSMMLSAGWCATRVLRGLCFSATVGFDAGSLRGNNFGALVGATYRFNL